MVGFDLDLVLVLGSNLTGQANLAFFFCFIGNVLEGDLCALLVVMGMCGPHMDVVFFR